MYDDFQFVNISNVKNKVSDQLKQTYYYVTLVPVQDAEHDRKNLPLIHQKVNVDNLVEAEVLLKDLFMDVDKAKRLQHPQATEIEKE